MKQSKDKKAIKVDFSSKKGITLMALTITIIVLVILAGVSLNLTTGNDGIVDKSIAAVKNHEYKEILEKVKTSVEYFKNGKVDLSTTKNNVTALNSDLIDYDNTKIEDDVLTVTFTNGDTYTFKGISNEVKFYGPYDGMWLVTDGIRVSIVTLEMLGERLSMRKYT